MSDRPVKIVLMMDISAPALKQAFADAGEKGFADLAATTFATVSLYNWPPSLTVAYFHSLKEKYNDVAVCNLVAETTSDSEDKMTRLMAARFSMDVWMTLARLPEVFSGLYTALTKAPDELKTIGAAVESIGGQSAVDPDGENREILERFGVWLKNRIQPSVS